MPDRRGAAGLIPVYAEMSSINPVFLLPGALARRAGEIGKGFVGSLTMGAGGNSAPIPDWCWRRRVRISWTVDDAGRERTHWGRPRPAPC